MELIILSDGMYHLVPVTKQMIEGITLLDRLLVNCFDLCDILRLKLTEYVDTLNMYMMKDGSGALFGCMCK